MGAFKDLTGQRFGSLTVIKRGEDHIQPSGKHIISWYCRCDCGKEKTVLAETLRNGDAISCGCGKFSDLTGQRFGRLIVIERADDHIQPNGTHKVQWRCKCDCGNECIVRGQCLRDGMTKSCGCFAKDRVSETHKKYNTYDLSGEYGIGYTSKGEEFYFDLEDYDKIKDYCWYKNANGYLLADSNRQKYLLHRLVLLDELKSSDKKYCVDHINGNDSKNDNRKSNLRLTTIQQNLFNRTYSLNSKSGFIGVIYVKSQKKWQVRMMI